MDRKETERRYTLIKFEVWSIHSFHCDLSGKRVDTRARFHCDLSGQRMDTRDRFYLFNLRYQNVIPIVYLYCPCIALCSRMCIDPGTNGTDGCKCGLTPIGGCTFLALFVLE
eukprot:1049966_1